MEFPRLNFLCFRQVIGNLLQTRHQRVLLYCKEQESPFVVEARNSKSAVDSDNLLMFLSLSFTGSTNREENSRILRVKNKQVILYYSMKQKRTLLS